MSGAAGGGGDGKEAATRRRYVPASLLGFQDWLLELFLCFVALKWFDLVERFDDFCGDSIILGVGLLAGYLVLTVILVCYLQADIFLCNVPFDGSIYVYRYRLAKSSLWWHPILG